MKVFCVLGKEYQDLYGVYSIKENAIKAIKNDWNFNNGGEFWDINEYLEFFEIKEIVVDDDF